jgi:Fe-S-cluster containining protein
LQRAIAADKVGESLTDAGPSMSDSWYKDGLRFECTRCGHCCTGEPGFVWVSQSEIESIAEFRREPLEEFIAIHTRFGPRGRTLREKANGECIFYDRKSGCTVYPVRPRQCRTWPFWKSNVENPDAWKKTCEICPGAGQGELISAEEITRRIKVIPL